LAQAWKLWLAMPPLHRVVAPWRWKLATSVSCRGTRLRSAPLFLIPAEEVRLGGTGACRSASTSKEQFESQLMPEDILHLRATSMVIMQDPICELPAKEVASCLVDRTDPIKALPIWHPRRVTTAVTQPFRERQLAVSNLSGLIMERLDNEQLSLTFDIDGGFNMQAYFMIVHVWLLHQRLVLEGSTAKRMDEELFENCWTVVRHWMMLKKVPEYRFDAELQNVQEYMLGCCLALDKALERSDILPARLQQALWANIYSGSVNKNAQALNRLTKYLLRQLGLVLQLDKEDFLAGNFTWADYPLLSMPKSGRELPTWRREYSEALAEA